MSVTIGIIAITVLASYYAWRNQEVFYKWIMNPYRVQHNREYYRFITSGLIHADQTHLFFNMITLFFFGDFIERIFVGLFGGTKGLTFYILLYLIAMVLSELPTFLKYRNNPNYNSLGASGAVSAVLFGTILFDPTSMILVFFVLPIPGFIFALLYLAYSYWSSKRMSDNINHDAHFYGALVGIIFSIMVEPRVIGHFMRSIADFF